MAEGEMTKQERYTALSAEIERCERELRGKRFLGVLTGCSDEKNYDGCELHEECFNDPENKPLTEDELTIIRGGNPYENRGETSVTEEELESAKIWYKEKTGGDINELTEEEFIQLALSLHSP
jgi:hypothetical protein